MRKPVLLAPPDKFGLEPQHLREIREQLVRLPVQPRRTVETKLKAGVHRQRVVAVGGAARPPVRHNYSLGTLGDVRVKFGHTSVQSQYQQAKNERRSDDRRSM